MIQKAIPVLPALNIRQTILFYESVLGFNAADQGDYAVMKKGDIELHFFLCTDQYLCENTRCYIKVSDVECLFTDMATLEIVQPKNKLKDMPRGRKAFCIKDNNGNLLRFVENK